MSVSSPMSLMSNLVPQSRRPRIARRVRHGWSPRQATLGLELRGNSLYAACMWPGMSRRWLSVTGVIENVSELDAAQLKEKLKALLAPAGVVDPLVVLGLPRRDVMVRHIVLPEAAEKSLDNAIQLQLGLYKPSDDEDFCWDAGAVKTAGQLFVSLLFVPRTRIEELTSKLHDAGFPIARLTTTQFASIEWTVRAVEEREQLAMLQVQSRGSEVELSLIDRGACVASRSFTLAGHDEPAQMQNEAAKLLASHRLNSQSALTVVYSGANAANWREALSSFGETKELAQFCDVWPLTETVDASPEEYWGAIALALDGIHWRGDYHLNLLPKELRPAKRRWQNAPAYALVAANLMLGAGLLARGPIQRQILLRRYNAEIGKLDKSASAVEHQMKKQHQIEDKLQDLRNFQEHGRRPLDALSSVAQTLPKDAWVMTFSCHQDQLDLAGTAKSASAVLPALKAVPDFENVQFAGALLREAEGAERFHIQMKLRTQ